MDYNFNYNYLTQRPVAGKKHSSFMLICGIVMIIIGVQTVLLCIQAKTILTLTIIFSLIALAGLLLVILYAKSVRSLVYATDEQYDASVKSGLANIKERALTALGLDESEVEEIDPIEFDGYEYKGADFVRMGRDRRYRSNKYRSVWIFFSSNEAHMYTYTFNTECDKHTESTDVYFYKDIVSVSTSSDTVQVFGAKVDYEYFKITTAGGNMLSVSLFDTNNVQRSINAMRALLREKKQA